MRNPKGANIIRKGTPLSIYSGELLVTEKAYHRERTAYAKVKRNYIFDLDSHYSALSHLPFTPRSSLRTDHLSAGSLISPSRTGPGGERLP